MRPSRWRFRRRTVVIAAAALVVVLVRVGLWFDPYWSESRKFQALALKEAHEAHDLRETAMSRPGTAEAESLRREAHALDTFAAYHAALGRKYGAFAFRPWVRVPPDPPPPPRFSDARVNPEAASRR